MFQRRFTESRLQVGSKEEGAPPVIEGYAARFDQLSEQLPGSRPGETIREIIKPGAFRGVLEEKQKVVANYQHDNSAGHVLGTTASGSLRLREDRNGLWYRVQLTDDPEHLRIANMIERGDITQSSFAFAFGKTRWEVRGDEQIRIIESVKTIRDVSVVLFPAYNGTSAEVREKEAEFNLRSLADWRETNPPTRRNLAERELRLRQLTEEISK